jgi:hypothetical protein
MAMHETENSSVVEHSELIDMRTHLTVAMLAASQLNRRTKEIPEAAHLQGYLDQSLKSLVDDVVRVDALVAQTDQCANAAEKRAASRVPRPVRWGVAVVKWGVSGVCAWAHRRATARLTTGYIYR